MTGKLTQDGIVDVKFFVWNLLGRYRRLDDCGKFLHVLGVVALFKFLELRVECVALFFEGLGDCTVDAVAIVGLVLHRENGRNYNNCFVTPYICCDNKCILLETVRHIARNA